MKDIVVNFFEERFGTFMEGAVCFAPGRVNLIGEHIDYNGGHVFPCALSMGTYAAARKRNDRKLMFCSANYPELGIVEGSLDELGYDPEEGWTVYPKGVMHELIRRGYEIPCGLEMMFYGNLPQGAGLSSSASIEVLTGTFLNELFGFGLSPEEIASIGQAAENDYVGVKCGIMDQFASAMGRKDHAILLNTSSMEHSYVPIAMEGYKIVIIDSNVPHKLSDSQYNERRSECARGLEMLRQASDIKAICDLDSVEFEKYKGVIDDPVVLRRVRHAVYENERTLDAAALLSAGDITGFGRLMNESHISLRDDYEVTGPELDVLAEEAWKIKGCIGSRMTGAGFGGSTVSIVAEDALDDFEDEVGAAYRRRTGLMADFYMADIGDGARVL
ncbi:MAG: galactokinase [Lachnospiraceae bacterium]|nr:galactokinase [Lachnospiraceae bacterium]